MHKRNNGTLKRTITNYIYHAPTWIDIPKGAVSFFRTSIRVLNHPRSWKTLLVVLVYGLRNGNCLD